MNSVLARWRVRCPSSVRQSARTADTSPNTAIALQKVKDRLAARASDADLEQLPAQAAVGQGHKPTETGRALAETKHPGSAANPGGSSAGGPPAGVPANGGRGVNPGSSRKPASPPGKKP